MRGARLGTLFGILDAVLAFTVLVVFFSLRTTGLVALRALLGAVLGFTVRADFFVFATTRLLALRLLLGAALDITLGAPCAAALLSLCFLNSRSFFSSDSNFCVNLRCFFSSFFRSLRSFFVSSFMADTPSLCATPRSPMVTDRVAATTPVSTWESS
ncbi:MAG: hypothetical protein A2W21_01660 [Betaproteobacteria bacterium RBG_16_66_20]|nr:MAG: hypothetical protein A2W21_01660 [Betaproteobacteria bacterium RBG_16_66_20]